VDLLVPPGFEAPRRVQPAGATWSASQSLLRWQLGAAAVPPGAAGSLVAAFRVKEGSEAAAAGIAACRAMLALRGEGGLWVKCMPAYVCMPSGMAAVLCCCSAYVGDAAAQIHHTTCRCAKAGGHSSWRTCGRLGVHAMRSLSCAGGSVQCCKDTVLPGYCTSCNSCASCCADVHFMRRCIYCLCCRCYYHWSAASAEPRAIYTSSSGARVKLMGSVCAGTASSMLMHRGRRTTETG
jgi:hypothetical protein